MEACGRTLNKKVITSGYPAREGNQEIPYTHNVLHVYFIKLSSVFKGEKEKHTYILCLRKPA